VNKTVELQNGARSVHDACSPRAEVSRAALLDSNVANHVERRLCPSAHPVHVQSAEEVPGHADRGVDAW
jgi:hypothetical protein